MKNKIIIDATNATLGRIASYAAKQALLGKEIVIINSEKAVVSGKKNFIIKSYKERRSKGGTAQKGPYFSRDPEKILKRTIRGMVPDHREGRGKEAFRRIKCYLGTPEEFKDEKLIKAGKKKNCNIMTIEEISKMI